MSGKGGRKREAVRHRRGSIEMGRSHCFLQDSDNYDFVRKEECVGMRGLKHSVTNGRAWLHILREGRRVGQHDELSTGVNEREREANIPADTTSLVLCFAGGVHL